MTHEAKMHYEAQRREAMASLREGYDPNPPQPAAPEDAPPAEPTGTLGAFFADKPVVASADPVEVDEREVAMANLRAGYAQTDEAA